MRCVAVGFEGRLSMKISILLNCYESFSTRAAAIRRFEVLYLEVKHYLRCVALTPVASTQKYFSIDFFFSILSCLNVPAWGVSCSCTSTLMKRGVRYFSLLSQFSFYSKVKSVFFSASFLNEFQGFPRLNYFLCLAWLTGCLAGWWKGKIFWHI